MVEENIKTKKPILGEGQAILEGEGIAVQDGIPESRFNHPIDFTAPSQIVDSHTESVVELDRLEAALRGAIEATENGKPAVIHVKFSD